MLIHIISLGTSKTNYKFVKYIFLNICFKTYVFNLKINLKLRKIIFSFLINLKNKWPFGYM